ncbi:hypothetical protein [Lactococcus lactis]|uniref:Uncharacterized protein n=2 Tax=Lactococcus lactis TaxID=1358 RepID=A0A552Z7X2_9LACT|nr:hypothetical protein [Lactococcus lactis]MDN5610282.1 hypothetical protein [Staphylococcus equorum]MDN6242382.1 hypothetical protein [Tetragenococcus koreensis]MDN6292137.1 hypothetical protein [Tetragenococcus halophilus]ARE20918.1 hypothetical protein LLUC06_1373 [Lactococcus lactis subsp. lactis]MBU3886384.1 hypothetical protein [Lactococcus lactis]
MTNKEILEEMLKWFSKRKKYVDTRTRINEQDIESLELLELFSYLETRFNVQFNLKELNKKSYESLENLSIGLSKNFNNIAWTDWYAVVVNIELPIFRRWLEFQFDRLVLFKIVDGKVLVGIQQGKNSKDSLRKIKEVVEKIEPYK